MITVKAQRYVCRNWQTSRISGCCSVLVSERKRRLAVELPEALLQLKSWADRTSKQIKGAYDGGGMNEKEGAQLFSFEFSVSQVAVHVTDLLCSLESLTNSLQAVSAAAAVMTHGTGMPTGFDQPPCYVALDNKRLKIVLLEKQSAQRDYDADDLPSAKSMRFADKKRQDN